MGRCNRALLAIAVIFLLLLLLPGMLFCQQISDDANAHVRDFTMPQYKDNDCILQFIVYGKKANNKGMLFFITDMVVDLMKNNLEDVATVTNLSNQKPYPLNAPTEEVVKYWSDKQHSQGLIFSDYAVLNQQEKTMSSEKNVKFRSPLLDADGVGFDVDQDAKTLHIRSQVRLTIRAEMRNQAMLNKTKPSENIKNK